MGEKNLDFDKITDRRNTYSLKYDFAAERGMPDGLLPLWVADMDFETSSYIQEALQQRVTHNIYGYSEAKKQYFEAVQGWMKRRHDWDVKEEWLVKTPGIVFALAMAVKAFTDPDDGVLIQRPVYYPFSEVIEDNGRRVVSSDLVLGDDHRYHIDSDDFEAKIVNEKIRLFLLCSPHNPAARVWTEEELRIIGDICVKHNVIVVSDEIHADFVFSGKHYVFADLKQEYRNITITCTSPSKTFNLAGLQISNIFIADPQLRHAFLRQICAAGYSQLNVMGIVACEAAYLHGDEWYEAMKSYVSRNLDYIKEYTETRLPGVTMTEHEGTYLAWLDFSGTGMTAEEIDDLIINKAGLWLDSGRIFGRESERFQRINAACPRSVLEESMERICRNLQNK